MSSRGRGAGVASTLSQQGLHVTGRQAGLPYPGGVPRQQGFPPQEHRSHSARDRHGDQVAYVEVDDGLGCRVAHRYPAQSQRVQLTGR